MGRFCLDRANPSPCSPEVGLNLLVTRGGARGKIWAPPGGSAAKLWRIWNTAAESRAIKHRWMLRNSVWRIYPSGRVSVAMARLQDPRASSVRSIRGLAVGLQAGEGRQSCWEDACRLLAGISLEQVHSVLIAGGCLSLVICSHYHPIQMI